MRDFQPRSLFTPRTVSLLILALGSMAATVASPTIPDKWAPFHKRRIASPSGSHYAVLAANGGYKAGPYSLHQRRKGVEPLRDEKRGEADAKDRVVIQGTLPRLPMEARVLDKPLGIVLFDTYARLGSGAILSLLDAKGETAWSVDLEDLFGGTPKGSRRTVSSLRWNAAWGIDQELGLAWVLTHGSEFRAVSLTNGKVTTPDADSIARWARNASVQRRARVLDALLLAHDSLGHVHGPRFAELADDKTQKLPYRLRAAIAAKRAGVHADSWLELFAGALQNGSPQAKAFAALHLVELDEPRGHAAFLEALAGYHARRQAPQGGGQVRIVTMDQDYALLMRLEEMGERGLARLRNVIEDAATPEKARIGAEAVEKAMSDQQAVTETGRKRR